MSEQLGHYARLDAIDFAGKTSQINLAREYNKKHNLGTVFVHEPGGTLFGQHIRSLLLTDKSVDLSPHVELLLFTADRLHLYKTVIEPALREDRPVVSDRGIESSVYQTAGGGLSQDEIYRISAELLPERYIHPDAIALLSISKETRRKRMIKRLTVEAPDKIESRDEAFTDRAHELYRGLELLPHTQVVDAERTEEEIFEDLKPILFGKFAA